MHKALPPDALMSGFYLSELVMSLTQRHDVQPEVFDHYDRALTGLREGAPLARELRLFEKRLLDVLGYGIPAAHHVGRADELGLTSVSAEQLDDMAVMEEIRPVLRRALAHCLDGRILKTRSVARSVMNLTRVSR
jgi:DNA repair protein RecO (recombination protein O)